MTRSQVAFQIDRAIDTFDFSEWDFTNLISELCDEFEEGEINDDEMKDEVEAILSNEFGLFGERLAKTLLKEILS